MLVMVIIAVIASRDLLGTGAVGIFHRSALGLIGVPDPSDSEKASDNQ